MKKFLLIFIFISSFSTNIFAQNIIALVDKEAITISELKNRAKAIFKLNNVPSNKQEQLYPQILEMLIDEKLYFKAAKLLKVDLGKNDLAEYINMLEKQNNIPEGQFRKYIENMGLDYAEIIAQMRGQLLWQKIVHEKFTHFINVSKDDIEFYKKRNYENQIPGNNEITEGIMSYRTNKMGQNYLMKLRREAMIVKYKIDHNISN